MSYARVADHRSMALDHHRNTAYFGALQSRITPDSVVLDLGAGLGIHGLMAARLGAQRVYCVEPEDIIRIAEQIAQANQLADRIICLRGRVEEIVLPEPVDVIVSVFTGNMLLTEDLLPSLFYARDRYLKPGGHLLPSRARLEVAPVSAPELFQREVANWSSPQFGLDLSAARPFAAHTAYYRAKEVRQTEYLADPQTLLTLDFSIARDIHCDQTVTFTIQRAAVCHGFAGWFAIELGATWLSIAPHEPEMHWTPVYMPIDPPLVFDGGEQVSFRLVRPAFTDWNWLVTAPQGERRHSTLFSRPWHINSLRKNAETHTPALNLKGQMIRFMLTLLNDQASLAEIADRLCAAYPNHLQSREEALDFVRRCADWYD